MISSEELIQRAAEGTLTAEEATELLRRCKADEACAEMLKDHLVVERLLRTFLPDPDGKFAANEALLVLQHSHKREVFTSSFTPRIINQLRTNSRRTPKKLIAALLAVVVLGLGLWIYFKQNLAGSDIAVIEHLDSVKWHTNETKNEGQVLKEGTITIDSGEITLRFNTGARLTAVGPVDMKISFNSVLLQRGKLSAFVPEGAHGFAVTSPNLKVVDNGTAFGVNADGSSEVQVFNGTVTVSHGTSTDRVLSAGSAVQCKNDKLEEVPFTPDAYPNGKVLSEMLYLKRFNDWKLYSDKLRQDPANLVSYTFEDEPPTATKVFNKAFTKRSQNSDAKIAGAVWTSGRWPMKHALQFSHLGDSLRFKIGVTAKAMTYLAWVRVDKLPNNHNSLLMPTGGDYGRIHWDISSSGTVNLWQMREMISPGKCLYDGPVHTDTNSPVTPNTWVQIVTTYDSSSGQIIHYLNGIKVKEGRFPNGKPASLSEMEFGNWDQRKDPTVIDHRPRNFVGALDELVVMSRVLTPAEVEAEFVAGKP